MDAKQSNRRHRFRRHAASWHVFVVPLLVTAVVVFAGWLATAAPTVSAELRAAAAIRVVDGDTIRVDGRLTRLVGFNTPETLEPACSAERRLGDQATQRLRELVDAGPVTFAEVACACRPGTQGTNACNFGRACGVLTVGGRDVGHVLIAERLAVPFVCTGTGCPPTPRPWCDV